MKQSDDVTDPFEGISELRERLGQNSGDGPIWQRLGFAMSRSGRHADTVRIFEHSLTLGASVRIQAIPHALSLSALARHEEAIAILRPLQARKRKDFELANLLGVVLKRAGRFRQALSMFELARGLRPGNISAWVNTGNTWEILGNFKEAAAAFGQAVRLKPADAELWRLHGVALFNQGLHEEARRSLDKAASLAPGDSKTFASRVHVLLELDRKDEAVAAIERFRSVRPDDHEATVMLARMRFRANRVHEARELLGEVLRVEPGHLSANLRLGLTCGDGVSEDNRRIANEAFRRALEANPDSWKAAERLVDSLSRSRHDSEAEHLEAAYAVASELQRKHPAERFQTARTLRTIFSRMMDLERLAATGRLAELLPQWQATDNFSAVHYELGQVQSIEDRKIAPGTVYGRTKAELARRLMTMANARTGVGVAWGRLFHLFGPGEAPQRLMPSILCALLDGREALCGPEFPVRDFSSTWFTAKALAALTASRMTGPVNVGSGQPRSIGEMARLVARMAGRADLLRFGVLPLRPGEAPFVAPDVSWLRQCAGFAAYSDICGDLRRFAGLYRLRQEKGIRSSDAGQT